MIAGPVAATGVVDAIECVAYTKATIVDLVRRVREQAPKTPILAKLTFNWGDELYPAAEAALKAGANGFTAIDSIGPTLQIDIETGGPTIGGAGSKAWMSGAAIRPVAQAVVSELAVRFPGGAHRRHGRHHPGRGRGGDDDGRRDRAGRLHRAPAARAGVVWPHGREAGRLAGQPRLCRSVGCPWDGAAETARVEDTRRLTFEFDPLFCTNATCVSSSARTMRGRWAAVTSRRPPASPRSWTRNSAGTAGCASRCASRDR